MYRMYSKKQISGGLCYWLLLLLSRTATAFTFDFGRTIRVVRGNHQAFGGDVTTLSLALKTETIVSEPPLFFATEIGAQEEPTTTTLPALKSNIQRSYRTFEWNHQNKTYKINYRVEEPPVPHGAFALKNAGGGETTTQALEQPPSPPQPQPVLLVHGFGANVNHFRHQYPALTQAGYRVFAIDLIGFGASEKATDVDYSIELFVQLLRDFIQEMNLRYYNVDNNNTTADNDSDKHATTWMIAGNSIGGLCCLGLAKEIPEQVQGVVLFNTANGMSVFRYEDVPFYIRPILYLVQNLILKGNSGKKFFSNFKTAKNVESILRTQGVYRNQEQVNEDLLEMLLGPADDEGAETVFLKVFGGPPGPTPNSLLSDVQCPILALWGEADPWLPYNKGAHPATEMVHQHADFQLHVLPETGHCPHDENPTAVHDHMIPWMKQVPQRYHPSAARKRGLLELSSSSTSTSLLSTSSMVMIDQVEPSSSSPPPPRATNRGLYELSSDNINQDDKDKPAKI